MKSYFTNRQRRVCVNSNFSMWEEIISGVPQGSILGPLLLKIFLNDLFLSVGNSDLSKYAAILEKVKQILRQDFEIVTKWFSETLPENCPNAEFSLVRIFPHSDWIQRDTEYLSVFSPNAEKYRPEKTPLNTERYGVSLRIQSECGEIQTRKKSVSGHFSRSENYMVLNSGQALRPNVISRVSNRIQWMKHLSITRLKWKTVRKRKY